ncbi:hypothetical protein BKA82DRAFT_832879 [Pisolithus tinctorius]|uniref:Heterokaryon incompatibility domain-containing protein n=1 Tax=Pisolithus tinctorius Marx 270 TaxID=870435 RepID=A0A0C3PBM2_PISTI|nr:hypothetical protein BKA82DRAFT_832879 [Pisolithus tinctorius]KIO11105.1 hypothetical protein M404DRAFT_832879 [Pisolithus tinctorius Marx 270]
MVPALGSRPVLARHRRSSADVASLLHALSQYLWERFRERATVADLDEAISLTTYVLELRLPGHPDYTISHEQLALFVGERVRQLERGSSLDRPVTLGRAVDNLRVLANYFRTSYRNQHATVDLNEAIKLYRYILQFYLISHPDRASSLHDLALCLADLFRHQHVAADLDEAIVLEQEALQLLIPDDPGYNISLYNLTACLHMKISPQVVTTSSHPPGVIHFDIEQVIRHFTFETLKTMPTRLLHTPTGVLCNRDVQISHFMRSQQCRQLLSSCKARTADQQIECIRTALSRYFQFVTLSHHWGEGEPLLRDVEGQSIYGMSTKMGFGKLQAFCVTACGRGYLWAWSDTCCIDKDSSAELQEAIGSMFSWYRRSALTIVYLSDVPDTSSFGSSKWFGRGWTLQELLAPSTVLFYTQNWSLYKNFTCRNHKTNVAVLEELERATGIEARFLTNFSPGMDDARSRLQWASSRRTTRPEDIAYSLFGIFDLHLPVLYGESTGKALGRLLAEIISQSGDISILDWIGEASSFHSCFPAHITSYQTLPLQPNAEHPLTISPASFPALRRLYRSLDKSPFPQFINRRLILPCITHRVTAVQVKGGDPSSPSYAYKIQASGLRPLEILLPDKLGDAAMEPSALQLIRPWHLKLLGPSGKLDATTEKQLLFTLRRPFSALLLIQLPHNEYKRIASSTPITAQLLDSVSILQSKIRTLTIV